MDRLSIFLTLMTGAVIAGGFLVAAFTLGYYSWPVILVLGAIGFGLAWPTGYLVSRWIKRWDPNFDHTRVKPGAIPDPNSREV